MPDGFASSGRQTKRLWRLWAIVAISIITTGCSASLGLRPTVGGYAVTATDSVPVAIDGYPRALYRDRYAYLVDGRWYYPTNNGWVVFLEEPTPLEQYRMRVQMAPPATRSPDVYYGYPPDQPPPPRPRSRPQELQREYRPE